MTAHTPLNDRLISWFSRESLSDVHLEVGQPAWLREAGHLSCADDSNLSEEAFQQFFLVHADDIGFRWEDIDSKLKAKGDVDLALSVGEHRLRVNLYRANGRKLCLAIRRIPQVPRAWDSLGLPAALLPLFNRSKGLILVTGPSGSGKSSTLAALIEHANTNSARHIVTIEDPVEYLFANKRSFIQQRQIGRDTPNFSGALRAALREDPDVIMIGELRDLDTIETALHAANTGHLVLGTLHTSGARQAIERIELVFPDQARRGVLQTLSSVLIAVISQVLVPHAHRRGLVLGYELLINNEQTRQSIKEAKINNLFSSMELGRRDGQVLLNQNLAQRVRAGDITREDATFYSYDPNGLDKELSYAR